MITKKLTAKTWTEIGKMIDDYLAEYMPAGYGTMVQSVKEEIVEKDNTLIIVATITRGENCD